MARRHPVSVAVAVACLIAAVILGLLSLATYTDIKSYLDTLSPDGDTDRFTSPLHGRIVMTLRAAAAVLLVLAPIVHRYGSRFDAGFGFRAAIAGGAHVLRRVHAARRDRLILLGLITLVGLIVRIYCLDQPMRSDESWSYMDYVTQPVILILSVYDSPNNHVLHTLLAHASIDILGDSPTAFRLPALIAGVLLVPAVFLLMRRIGEPQGAMLAASMVAVWPPLVDYSTNGRGYSLMILLSVLLFVAADRFRRRSDAAAVAAFAIVSSLGLYTIPAFGIPLLGAGIWLVMALAIGAAGASAGEYLARLTLTACVSVLGTGLLYLPILIVGGPAALVGNEVVTGTGEDLFAAGANNVAQVWSDWQQSVPVAIQGLLAVGAVAFLWQAPWRNRLVWVALAIAGVIVVWLQGTVGPPRIWIFLLPLFLGAAAGGLAALARHIAYVSYALPPAVAVSALIVYFVNPPGRLYAEFGRYVDASAVTQFIHQNLGPEDALATAFPANRTINYYAERLDFLSAVSAARENLQEGRFDRAIIVLTPGRSFETTMASISRARKLDRAKLQFEVTAEHEIGSSRVLFARAK